MSKGKVPQSKVSMAVSQLRTEHVRNKKLQKSSSKAKMIAELTTDQSQDELLLPQLVTS
jgi:hypothetical protein